MVAESVLWTVLPNGRLRDGRLRATVVMSPRLTAAPGHPFQSIRAFPAFTDWPATLAGITWKVEAEGPGELLAELDDRVAAPTSQTWHLVFGDAVGVVDHAFVDRSDRTMRSFPADKLAHDVLGIYKTVARLHPWDSAPVTTGPIGDLADAIGDIGDRPDDQDNHAYPWLDNFFTEKSSLFTEESTTPRSGRYLVRSDVPKQEQRRVDYLQAYRFYDRYSTGQRVRTSEAMRDEHVVPASLDRPTYDFHSYVAALGDYPALLRMLGLAIDLVLPDLPKGKSRLRLVPGGEVEEWMTTEATRPWLNYLLDDVHFVARSRDSSERIDIDHGQLHFDDNPRFSVHQIDIDGSVLKTANLAATARTAKEHLDTTKPSMSRDEITLPALRGAGFTVVRTDRAAQVVAQLDHSLANEQTTAQGQPADLFAEDVVRGYRVDVASDADGFREFRALYKRTGSYTVRTDTGRVRIDIPPDDGYTKAASTTAVPDDESELYLHEALFSWSGWSQVVQRPGARITPDEEILQDQQVPLEADAALPLVTSFEVTPGTLPRLRYGTEYRFRACLVDLAGNSIDLEAADQDDFATTAQKFLRWEPVPPPSVVPRRPYTEGESQLRMVIRSTAGTTAQDYVALRRVQMLPGHTDDDTTYHATNDRWLVPPKSSQQMAELHGVFDKAIGPGASQADRDAAFDISIRESGVLDPRVPGDELALPYLPDVSSRGVSLTSLPADPQSTHLQQWPGDAEGNGPWWDRQPLRIRIEHGPADAPVTPSGTPRAPHWEEAPSERLLRIYLPQAEVVRVRLSSHLTDPDLDIQGVWNLVADEMNAVDRAKAVQGLMWLTTPPVTLSLVHAVEKPLLDPQVSVPNSGMERDQGQTHCVLRGAIDNHAKSTGRIDVDAVWTEQVDDVAMPAPLDGVDGRRLRHAQAHVGDFSMDPDEDHCRTGHDDYRPTSGQAAVHRLRHELGDTKHRLVGYTATGTTRFREYFPPEVIDGVDDDGNSLVARVGPTVHRHVPSSRRPEPPEIAYIVPTFEWRTEGAGPTLAQPLPRPVPRFPRRATRTRIGGLRVYLRRPWFSSGDGELLGVVIADQPWLTWPIDLAAGLTVPDEIRRAANAAAGDVLRRAARRPGVRPKVSGLSGAERLLDAVGVQNAQLDPATARREMSIAADQLSPIDDLLQHGLDPETLVTRWGADPIRDSASPAHGPYVHQMPLRTAVGCGLSLAESDQDTVTVVGHTPQFDIERGLWFCDIHLDAGSSYLPFVRLGLCRYQPHSIDGAEISRVTTTDFIQLVPRRTTTFTPRASSAQIQVRGPAGQTWAAESLTGPGPSLDGLMESHRLTAQLQILPAGADPDLGWLDTGPEVDLPPTQATSFTDVRWSGVLTPAEQRPGQLRRVMVREFELQWADDETSEPLGRTRPPRSPSTIRPVGGLPIAGPTTLRERLVYADAFNLPTLPKRTVTTPRIPRPRHTPRRIRARTRGRRRTGLADADLWAPDA